MPRGKRYKAPEQSFLGNHSIDDLAKAATPEEYKEENNPVVEEPTIGDLGGHTPEMRINPRILVSDVPFEGQTPDPQDAGLPPGMVSLGEAANAVVGAVTAQRMGIVEPIAPAYVPPPGVTYRQRIQVLEPFRYPGHLKTAPTWVDRNWIVYFTYDEANPNRAPGPGLRVPGVGDVHAGDFLVMQKVALDDTEYDVRMAVYTPEEFFRWFIPVNRGENE